MVLSKIFEYINAAYQVYKFLHYYKKLKMQEFIVSIQECEADIILETKEMIILHFSVFLRIILLMWAERIPPTFFS